MTNLRTTAQIEAISTNAKKNMFGQITNMATIMATLPPQKVWGRLNVLAYESNFVYMVDSDTAGIDVQNQGCDFLVENSFNKASLDGYTVGNYWQTQYAQ